MKYLAAFCMFLAVAYNARAQCGCENCPVPIISNVTTIGTININGAVNAQLGVNGQRVCQVCVEFVHDAPDELDFFLIAPSGSQVQLIENSGLSVNDDITFDICFLTCDQTAEPDPGFPPVFDSGAGWVAGQTYTGTYYPFDPACLESLTGDVNGTWTLQMTDNVSFDDGTLFNWYLVFDDDAGIGCENAADCGPACLADAGVVSVPPDTFCVGDPALSSSGYVPFYDGVTNVQPPATDYGYTFAVALTDLDAPIIEFSPDPDLTGYPPGTYAICGYSYLLADEPLIPTPDGVLTLNDLEVQIANGEICADKMNICFIRTIAPQPPLPDFTGPLQVCAGENVQYVLSNNEPIYDVEYQVTSGSILAFNVVEDTVNVTWGFGPGTLCAQFETVCGTEQTCLTIDVTPAPSPLLSGNFSVCGGSTETYTVTPLPGPGENYVFSVTNGAILSETSNQFTVQWPTTGALGQICAELVTPVCTNPSICLDIPIDNEIVLPAIINTPAEICVGDNASASIPLNLSIISYDWTGTGLSIESGQGTNTITFSTSTSGTGTLCVEVTTACGTQGPLCEDIILTDLPSPMITPVDPACTPTVLLSATLSGSGSGSWSQIDGPPGVVFADPGANSTSATFPQAGIYNLQFTEIDGLCSGTAVVTVEILPDLQVSTPQFDCDVNQEYTITFDILTGQPPYSINGTGIAGNVFTSASIPSGQPYAFLVEDALGCSVEVQGIFDCPCLSDAGTMPPNTIEVCGAFGQLAVASSNGDFNLDGNDTGTYILHDNPGPGLGTILDENPAGEFAFGPGLNFGQIYYISFVVGNDAGGFVDLSDPCLSVAIGQPVIFYDIPTATLIAPPATCNLTFEIDGALSAGVTQILWTQIAGPAAAVFSDPLSLPTSVTVGGTGTYVLQLQMLNAACLGTAEVTIQVLELPEIVTPEEVCNAEETFYVLSFQVIDGSPPYTASIPGTFNGNIFTSDPIPSGTDYAVFVTDNNGCSSEILVGDKSCDCVTSAGTMEMDLIGICGTTAAIAAISDGNASLDADDVLVYYLHTSPGNALGTVIDSNVTGVFNFQDGMVLDSIYYISIVTGNALDGFVDLSDPCLDVAPGQPVVWYSFPDVTTGAIGSTCGDTLLLTQGPANGIWDIISAPENSIIFLLNFSDSTTTITADSAGQYILSWTAENAAGCIASDTLTVYKLPSPRLINQETICSADLLTYTFSFEITGDIGPYLVNGQPSGPIFTSQPIPVDSISTFTVISGSGCETPIQAGPVTCDCVTDAGTISGVDQTLCTDELLEVAIANNDALLDPNDTLAYILHDGTLTDIGNVLAVSYGTPISFGAPLQVGQQYVLSVVAGNHLAGNIQLDDPCLDLAGSVTVQWDPLTSVSIDTAMTACIGETVTIGFDVQGAFPIAVFLVSSEMDTISTTLSGPADSVDVEVTTEVMTWEIGQVAGTCVRNLGGSVTITGQMPRDVQLVAGLELCNTLEFGGFVLVADLIAGNPTEGVWDIPGLMLQNDTLFAAGVAPGTYTATFDTRGFEGACPGDVFTTTIEVIDCNCPPVDLPANLELCNTTGTSDLSIYIPFGLNGTWSVENPTGLPDPPTIEQNVLSSLNSSAGTYTLVLTLTDELPVFCETQYAITLIISEQLRSGTQVNFPVLCNNDDDPLNLFDLLEDADQGGIWQLDGNTVDPVQLPTNLEIGTYAFSYTIPAAGICSQVSTEVSVTIASAPVYDGIVTDASCAGDTSGAIDIVIDDLGDGPYNVFLDQVLQTETQISGIAPGEYQLIVSNASGCTSVLNVVVDDPDPLTLDLGQDQVINAGGSATINASTNVLVTEVDSIIWIVSGDTIVTNNLMIILPVEQDVLVRAILADTNGCTASDELFIILNDNRYYIPNVFNPQSDNPANRQFGLMAGPGVERISTFTIYDRWGGILFSVTDALPGDTTAFWDGTVNGEVVQPGVYVYVLRLTVNGRERLITGDVTLVR